MSSVRSEDPEDWKIKFSLPSAPQQQQAGLGNITGFGRQFKYLWWGNFKMRKMRNSICRERKHFDFNESLGFKASRDEDFKSFQTVKDEIFPFKLSFRVI